MPRLAPVTIAVRPRSGVGESLMGRSPRMARRKQGPPATKRGRNAFPRRRPADVTRSDDGRPPVDHGHPQARREKSRRARSGLARRRRRSCASATMRSARGSRNSRTRSRARASRSGDRVASFGWNSHRHLELYYAVPCMGAVLHTDEHPALSRASRRRDRSRRRSDDLRRLRRSCRRCARRSRPIRRSAIDVRHHGRDGRQRCRKRMDYETLLGAEHDVRRGPTSTKTAARCLCYTSATTGDPKGVAVLAPFDGLARARGRPRRRVRHRRTRRRAADRADVPRQCVGIPYLAPMLGAKLVMPGPRLDPAGIIDIIERERVTISPACRRCGSRCAMNSSARRLLADAQDARHRRFGRAAVALRRYRSARYARDPRVGHDRDEPDRHGERDVSARLADAPWDACSAEALKQGRFTCRRMESARRRRQRGAARRRVARRALGARPGRRRVVL